MANATTDRLLYSDLSNQEPSHINNLLMLRLYNVANHGSSSKIEDIQSCDSTNTCDFCRAMQQIDGSICQHCYACEQSKRFKNIDPRHQLNSDILGDRLYSVEELKILNITSDIGRFNEDGDLTGDIMAINYLRICKAFPHVKFGLWFKNKVAMKTALKAEGKPDNVKLIYSDPFINGSNSPLSVKPDYADYIFRVYDKDHIAQAIAAGANPCNGNKCKRCGFKCYLGFDSDSDLIAEVLG